ncbi:MAG TPA: T9SS type A sorting domain-containing protein, partial [Bacteroidota bacterium]|nr:T9SS type A sorting domain-containing protein [Bacteroidota bacterium]
LRPAYLAAACSALFGAIALGPELCYAQWVRTDFPDTTVMCMVAKDGDLFAGTWGYGVFKSTDGGNSWTAANNGLTDWHYTGYVYALAVVPSTTGDGTNLFAGMEEGGIWRSTDDGDSWTWVYPTGVLGDHNLSISFLGVAGSTVVGGARQQTIADGIYRSNDDGVSWTRSDAGFSTAADSNISSFTSIQVGGTTYLYAGTDGGVFLSTNAGASWGPISNGLPSGSILSLAAVPGPGGGLNFDLFAGVRNSGMFRSTDNGGSWIAMNNGLPTVGVSPIINAIAASPVPNGTASSLFASYTTVYLSTDFGDSWWNTEWPTYQVGDANCLTINGGTLFAGAVGVWKYSIATDSTWSIQTSGTTDSLWCVKAVNNNMAWTGGSKGGVFVTGNGGISWAPVGGGAIGSATVDAIEALDAGTAYVSCYAGGNGTIYRTTNGGSLWSAVANVAGVAIGGIQMKTPLEGYAVGTPVSAKWTILKTTDGGTSWTALPTGPAVDSLTAVAINYYGPYFMRPRGVQLLGDTLWFGSLSGMVYRSTNLGASWSTGLSNVVLNALHFNSSAIGLAGGAFDGSTRSSVSGGASWDTAGAIWSKPVTCIGGSSTEFWATTGGAIAYTNSGGQNWSFSSPGYWGIFEPLNAISFSSAGSLLSGWAVGDSGLILHYQRGGAAAVKGAGSARAGQFSLEQNFPNPFNPTTTIRYTTPRRSHIVLSVYNSLGQRVSTIVNNIVEPGEHQARFDGSSLASGIYFYRLQADAFVQTRKLVLVR